MTPHQKHPTPEELTILEAIGATVLMLILLLILQGCGEMTSPTEPRRRPVRRTQVAAYVCNLTPSGEIFCRYEEDYPRHLSNCRDTITYPCWKEVPAFRERADGEE